MNNGIAFSRLKHEMNCKNLTITEIAKEIGVSRETLSKKLSLKHGLFLWEAVLIKVKFFQEIPIEELFEEIKNAYQ